MKIRITARFMAGILGSALAFAAVLPVAQAGEMIDSMQAQAVAPGPMSSLIDPITGEVALGYDSHYVFRGQVQGENSPWGSVDINVPVREFDLGFGAWYINNTDPRAGSLMPNDELNLSASLGTDIGPVTATIDYIAYLFPETNNQQDRNEVGLRLQTTFLSLDFGVGYYHDFDLDSNYFEYWVARWIELTDRVSLHLDVTLGQFSDNFSNVLLTAALAIQVTERMTFEPFISGTIDGGDIAAPNRDDQLFGGAKLSILF